jgi:hypothetical protein
VAAGAEFFRIASAPRANRLCDSAGVNLSTIHSCRVTRDPQMMVLFRQKLIVEFE